MPLRTSIAGEKYNNLIHQTTFFEGPEVAKINLKGSGFPKITGMAHLSFGKFPNQNCKPD